MDDFDKMIESGSGVIGAGPAGQAVPTGLRAEDTTNAAGIEQSVRLSLYLHRWREWF